MLLDFFLFRVENVTKQVFPFKSKEVNPGYFSEFWIGQDLLDVGDADVPLPSDLRF